MDRGNNNRRIMLAMLCVALSLGFSALAFADVEIEFFGRYRIDKLDNNNNGFVQDTDDPFQDNDTNPTLAAEELAKIAPPAIPTDQSSSNRSVDTNEDSTPLVNDFSEFLNRFDPSPGSFTLAAPNSPNSTSFSSSSNVPTTGISLDLSDVVTLPTSFVEMTGGTYLQSCSMQVENVIRFSPRLSAAEKLQSRPRDFCEVYYGFRYYKFDDYFGLFARGGVLGQMSAYAQSYNQMPGPHVGVHFNVAKGGWQLDVSGLAQTGLYLGNAYIDSSIGADLKPARYNRSFYLGPTTASDAQKQDFATLLAVIRRR